MPPATPPAPEVKREFVFRRCRANVRLTCTDFVIDVTPFNCDYFLALIYLDTKTNVLYRFIAGPLQGRITDPFGETRYLLLEAELRVPGEQTVAVHLPRACLGTPVTSRTA